MENMMNSFWPITACTFPLTFYIITNGREAKVHVLKNYWTGTAHMNHNYFNQGSLHIFQDHPSS